MTMKKLMALGLSAVMALSMAAMPAAAEEAETVKIGLMVGLTGYGVQAGEECQALAHVFEEIINNEHPELNLPLAAEAGLPNLGGAKVEFVVGDQSSTDIAQSEAERLITEEGVIGICGNFSSATTKTAMVAAEKYGVPLLSEGTSTTLVEAGYEYFGRTFPGDDKFIADSFAYLDALKEGGAEINTICLVSEDSEFGTNIAKIEEATAKEHGYEIVENISYSKDATNVTSEVLRVAAADADVVMMSSYATDALLFMRSYKEQGYFPKMLFGQRGGFMASDFTMNLANDSDYVFTTSRWNADMDNDPSRQITELFLEAYPNAATLLGDTLTSVWDGVVIACAANQAGSTDGDAIRAAMAEGVDLGEGNDPFALEGYVYPEENGQNEFGTAIVVQYKDSELHTVYPFEGASQEAVFPAPGWNER